jgi:hypothetical protein
MISDLIEENGGGGSGFSGADCRPFLAESRPGFTDALLAGQINSSFAPHSSESEASAVLSWW